METARFLRKIHLACILAVTASALLPFSIHHFLAGNTQLLAITAGANSAVALLLVYLLLTGHMVLTSLGLVAATGLGMLWSTWTQGMGGATWAYPLVVAIYLLFRPRGAITTNAVLLLGIFPGAILSLDPGLASRFLMTVTMVSAFSGVFALAVERGYRRADRLAQTDPLTATLNRRLLPDTLAAALERRGQRGETSTLIVLDVDHFKSINDAHGHARGDDILVRLGELLRGSVRDEDRIFRYGGEEFVILLPGEPTAAAVGLAERLRRDVARYGEESGFGITISLGIAELQDGDTVDGWLDRADQALLVAKRQGRNRARDAGFEAAGRWPEPRARSAGADRPARQS